MELQQLQQAWEKLNERVAQNELIQREQVIKILSSMKYSGVEKLLHLEKTVLIIFCIASIIIVMGVFTSKNFMILFITGIPLALAIFGECISISTLNRIKNEENLENQILNIFRYKRIRDWGYIIGYLSIIPAIILFFYIYPGGIFTYIFIGLIIAGIITDYVLFNYTSDKIREFSKVNKEIAELKKEIKK